MPTEQARVHVGDDASIGTVVAELARAASVEVMPRQVAALDIADWLPAGTHVYVPSPPGAHWTDTVDACRGLRATGMCPVPHLTARSVPDAEALHARLAQLAETGVDRLLLIAGDGDKPAGRYRDTLDVLESGLLAEYGFDWLGIAAHPEGHPHARPADLERALARKLEYAAAFGASMWIVTQFGFAPAATVAWLNGLSAEGVSVRAGVAGPARLATLLAFAARCGVRASARLVARRPSALRLAGRYAPDAVLEALACHASQSPATPLRGIHVFAFGGLKETSRWLRAAAARADCSVHARQRLGEQHAR